MTKKDHYGENVHRMGQVPEGLARGKSPDLLRGSRGNIPPAQVKRIVGKTGKRQAKKNPKQTQT